MENSLYLEVKK